MSWEASVQRERERLDALREIDDAEDRFETAEVAFMVAAQSHCEDPGDPDTPLHEWPSYLRMHDAHRAYDQAARELGRLRP